jgi:ubiquitin carboxyl-terminal hydrolase L3
MADSQTPHRKRFIPLESNPEVFTQLIRNLGVHSLRFEDVYSLDDPDLLAMVPRPVLALVMVFPVSETYEQHRKQDDAQRAEYSGSGESEDVIWYKQTIHNACGLYGILHAISNGNARNFISMPKQLRTMSYLLTTRSTGIDIR